jgi:AraC-like DNA-binding protein
MERPAPFDNRGQKIDNFVASSFRAAKCSASHPQGGVIGLLMGNTSEASDVNGAPQTSPQVQFLWTRGIAARETLYYLDRREVDAEQILSKAELSRRQLQQDPGGVSVASQHQFLELAAIQMNDPLLGLHVAAELDLREIGLLFYLAASSATVSEALEYLARYAATTNEEIRLEISRRDDEAVLTFHAVIGLDVPRAQFSELIALAFNRVLRAQTNRDFVPSRMSFGHARNSEIKEVHRILRCPVEFAQPTDCWVLPQSVMDLPILSEDSRLLRILEAHADHLLGERQAMGGLRGTVENQIVGALASGRVQAAVIANQLGMSERSLRRGLSQEQTSFGEILDRVRRRLALRYLEDDRVSVQQTAWLLGYSEIGAFSHAFKRWTGTSPGRARRSSHPREREAVAPAT